MTFYSICGTGRFQERGQCLYIGLAGHSLFVSTCFPFLFFHTMVGIVGLGSSDKRGVNRSLPALHYQLFLIIIIILFGKFISGP